VRKYLLGQLAEGEREWLEERLLTDDEFYETLTALEDKVEDELIDEYVEGELTVEGHEHFERLLLSTPQRADKLRLVEDLIAHRVAHRVPVAHAVGGDPRDPAIATPPPRPGRVWVFGFFKHPLFGLSSAAALLLVAFCCVWLLVKSNRLEAELAQARAQAQPTPAVDAGLKEQLEQLRAHNEELNANLRRAEEERIRLEQQASAQFPRNGNAPSLPKKAGQQTPSPFIATLTLSPAFRGPEGGEKIATLTLDRLGAPARLTLNVNDFAPGDYQKVRAVLRKSLGGEVWSSDTVQVITKRRKSRAVLTLPAGTLSQGQYTVDLEGIDDTGSAEPVGLYSFRIVIKDVRQRAAQPQDRP
jgi:hypothetical protein